MKLKKIRKNERNKTAIRNKLVRLELRFKLMHRTALFNTTPQGEIKG